MHSKLLKNEEVVDAIKRDSINFLNLFFPNICNEILVGYYY